MINRRNFIKTGLASCFGTAFLGSIGCGRKDNFPFGKKPSFTTATYPGEWQGKTETGTHLRLVGNFDDNILTETFSDGWRRAYVAEEGKVRTYFRFHPEKPGSSTMIGGGLGNSQPLLQQDYDTALSMIYYEKHHGKNRRK